MQLIVGPGKPERWRVIREVEGTLEQHLDLARYREGPELTGTTGSTNSPASEASWATAGSETR